MAHKRLVISAVIGVIAAAGRCPASPITRMLIGWDVGVLIYLVAAAVVMAQCSSVAQMKSNAAAQDEGAFAILILTVAAAIASLGAIFAELAVIERTIRTTDSTSRSPSAPWCCPGPSSTPSSPCTTPTSSTASGVRKSGLQFPGDDQPDYWDFVYFAFVIGMTFQVSDVAVTHKSIRRMVVAHGVLSFFFTTAIVAMTVNIAASVIQK